MAGIKKEKPKPVDHYTEWCKQYGVTHGHCPIDCEHPQPFMIEGSKLICGRCAILSGVINEMVPCVPEVCNEVHKTDTKAVQFANREQLYAD